MKLNLDLSAVIVVALPAFLLAAWLIAEIYIPFEVRSYAEAYGVSYGEASRRLDWQSEIGELHFDLLSEERDSFADLSIQHKPAYSINVLLKRGSNGAKDRLQKRLANKAWKSLVKVQEVELSLVELEEKQRLDRIQERIEWEANYSIRDSSDPWFPLTRAKWTMKSIQYPGESKQNTFKNGFAVKKVVLTIHRTPHGGQIGFHLGCNWYGTKLKLLDNNKLQSEEWIGTARGCEKQAQDADDEIADLLNVSHFSTNESNSQPTLALQSKNGTQLYFRGETIPEVKHDAELTIRRIEFKQRKKESCAKQGCQEWREVFIDNGAVTHKSEWQYNPQKIHDFKPESNYWYNLRIKEFTTQAGPVWYLKFQNSASNLESEEEWLNKSSSTRRWTIVE